jgi:DNA repair protein RadA/Sms
VEVQALVSPTRYPFPKRVATGLDINRCQILLAALEKHAGLNLDNKDVYINLAGGLKLKDPALDLALCAAVLSSAKETPVSHEQVFMGEAGILGTVAKVPLIERRCAEAGRLGLKQCVTAPLSAAEKKGASRAAGDALDIKEVSSVSDLYRAIVK